MQSRESSLVTRYLLGDLSDAEEEFFEREYFRSDDAFEALLAAENELIDDYVEERLSPADRVLFEQRFLVSPDRRERVEFARSLATVAAAAPPGPSPAEGPSPPRPAEPRRRRLASPAAWLGWSAAALLALATGATAMRLLAVHSELERRRAAGAETARREAELRRAVADQGARVEKLAGDLGRVQEELGGLRPAAKAVSVLLRAGLPRDTAARPAVVVSADTSRLLVQVLVPDGGYASYETALETVDGRRLLTRGPLSLVPLPAGPAVQFWLDARPLPGGYYVVTLRGTDRAGRTEDVAVYTFRLRRQD